MPDVSTGADAYQSLETIRSRIDYKSTDLYESQNAQLEFDELLVRLETESRGIFETLWGDQTPLEETDRVDTKRTTDDAAMPLVYPIQSVSEVEYKTTIGSDWETLDADRYDVTDHRLVLAARPSTLSLRTRVRTGNPLTRFADRASWRDLAAKIRVTYDRGFSGGAPADVKSIQIALINQMLRKLKREQTVAAASPEELAGMTDMNEVLTEEVRNRISDVTKPGLATQSI
jgi:hypothetical protein